MKIFILSYIYDEYVKDDMGGYRKVYELTENLEKLGHEILLFLPKINYKFIPVQAIRIPVIDLPIVRPIVFNALLFFYLLYYTMRMRPDVIFSRPINFISPLLVARFTSTYFAIEVNGDQCRHLRMIGAHHLKIKIVKTLEHINFRLADRIFPITPGLGEMLKSRYGVPESKLSVIESGSNLNLFRPMNMKACKELLNLSPDHKYIGFVGTFFKYQGIDTLIDSGGKVISRFPEARFLIVGDGVMKTEWMRQIRKAGLADYFIFPGQVPYIDVPNYINAMTVCVAPFTKSRGETSPLKLFDYFACAKPVVSSDIPSVHQILLDSKAAILVTPEDPKALAKAVNDIISDNKKQNDLGANGRDFVISKYSWEAKAKSLVSIIEEDIMEVI